MVGSTMSNLNHHTDLSKTLHIVVIVSGRIIAQHAFNQQEISIGRSKQSDLFLDNISVSRQHAKIKFIDNEFFIEDLNSSNGIYIKDQRVVKSQLNPNDIVKLGKFHLHLLITRQEQFQLHTSELKHTSNTSTPVAQQSQTDDVSVSHIKNHLGKAKSTIAISKESMQKLLSEHGLDSYHSKKIPPPTQEKSFFISSKLIILLVSVTTLTLYMIY